MKQRMRAYFTKDRLGVLLPFALLWAFMAVCHLLFKAGLGDDAMYARVIPEQGLWAYLVWAYRSWSARSLIDVGMCVLNYLPPLVWRLTNPLMIVGCAAGLYTLAASRPSAMRAWLCCGLVLLYPWQVLSSAGWVTTTLVYLWPACFGVLAMVPTAQLLRGKKPHTAACVAAVAGVLYAANMEQMLIILLPVLLAALVYLLVKRRVHALVVAQLCAALANLVWILACPGTKSRFLGEATSWFPEFGMKSFFSKAELGMSAALADVLFSPDAVFFWFCVVLAWAVFSRYKNVLYRLMALVPVCVSGVFGMLGGPLARLVPQVRFFTEALNGQGTITLANCNSLVAYLPMLLLYGTLGVCVVCIYLALGHSGTAVAAMGVLLLGFLSRAAMGFSPSIWVSGPRTGFFFSLATVLVAAMVYGQAVPQGIPAAPLLYRQRPLSKRVQIALFWGAFSLACAVQLYAVQELRIATGYG